MDLPTLAYGLGCLVMHEFGGIAHDLLNKEGLSTNALIKSNIPLTKCL